MARVSTLMTAGRRALIKAMKMAATIPLLEIATRMKNPHVKNRADRKADTAHVVNLPRWLNSRKAVFWRQRRKSAKHSRVSTVDITTL